jgi:hypothetical protein
LGGEYEKLHGFFQKVGITHHVSCPHAHQQNGSAERKHRHIVDVGLALLANASMPLKYWDEAFLTATFLINLLPSKVLNFMTPVEKLLNVKPNYDSLRVFGCACWPNLRPYNTRKLAFRSKRCIFLGYSPMHKGVKCLDVSIGRRYISRDVIFDENIFPFHSLHPNAGSRFRKEILLLPHDQGGMSNNGDHMHAVPVTNPTQIVADADKGNDVDNTNDEENGDANSSENSEENRHSNAEISQNISGTDSGTATPETTETSASARAPGDSGRSVHRSPFVNPPEGATSSSANSSPESSSRIGDIDSDDSRTRAGDGASNNSNNTGPSSRVHAPSSRAHARDGAHTCDDAHGHDISISDGSVDPDAGSSAGEQHVPLPVLAPRTRLQKGIKNQKYILTAPFDMACSHLQ